MDSVKASVHSTSVLTKLSRRVVNFVKKPKLLFWLFIALNLVPNFCLLFTEPLSGLGKLILILVHDRLFPVQTGRHHATNTYSRTYSTCLSTCTILSFRGVGDRCRYVLKLTDHERFRSRRIIGKHMALHHYRMRPIHSSHRTGIHCRTPQGKTHRRIPQTHDHMGHYPLYHRLRARCF